MSDKMFKRQDIKIYLCAMEDQVVRDEILYSLAAKGYQILQNEPDHIRTIRHLNADLVIVHEGNRQDLIDKLCKMIKTKLHSSVHILILRDRYDITGRKIISKLIKYHHPPFNGFDIVNLVDNWFDFT